MKLNVLQSILNYSGKPVYDENVKRDDEGKTVRDTDNKPVLEDVKLTLRSVLNTALLASEPDKTRTAEDKSKADQILRKVWEKKEVDFTTKDGGYIIEKVGIFFNPLILGRVENIFDGVGEKKEKETGA